MASDNYKLKPEFLSNKYITTDDFERLINGVSIDQSKLTIKKLIEIKKWADKHKVGTQEVINKRHAKLLTKMDKLIFGKYGKKWKVGDKYYELIVPEYMLPKRSVEGVHITKDKNVHN